MKVLLTTLNSKYTHKNIALYYLQNKIKHLCEVSFLNLNINDLINNNLNKILASKPEVVCFGVYIWNLEITLKLAADIKAINPSVIIGFGGPEVSYNPDEILSKYPFVDSVLCGESENNIVAFIQDIQLNNWQKKYNLPVEAVDIPRITPNIINDYDGRIVYFETSRGCAFNCSYCLSCLDLRVRYFDLELVKEDLKKLLALNVKQIRFIDRTFNVNKERALAIWQFLLQNRYDTTFHFEICAALIDEEVLTFLKDVPKDIFRFEIGLQSTNKKTLSAINRRYDFIYEKKVIKKLVKMDNIHLHVDLIIGLPYETLDIFKKSFNDVYGLHANELQLGFLKFLKGTDIYLQKEEYGYEYSNYPPYEVLQNKFLAYEEIAYLKKFETVFEYLYNSKKFLNSMLYLETKFTDYYTMYEYITGYFIKHNLLDTKVAYDNIYEHLINLFNHDEILIQTLTYDFMSNFKGTRTWFYHKYDVKHEIKEREKEFKYLILDYDIKRHQVVKTIYKIKKEKGNNE